MVKGGEMSGFGGGSLEHPRRWLAAQRAGLFLGVYRAAQSRQERPEVAQGARWGTAKRALRPCWHAIVSGKSMPHAVTESLL